MKKISRAQKSKQKRIRGHGGYEVSDPTKQNPSFIEKVTRPFTDNTPSQGIVNKVARQIGSAIGDAIPGLNKLGAGSALGNAASWFSRLLGFGDYAVSKNSFMSQAYNEGRPASFHGSRKGADIIVKHEEFVMDVHSSPSFTTQDIYLNPGNPRLAAFLWQIAAHYEEYEFLGMVFEYRPTSFEFSSQTGSGVVVLATDYDISDANYSDKRTMEASEYATSCKPTDSMMHPIECDPKRNILSRFFVKPGFVTPPTTGEDTRLDYLGRTTLAVVGSPVTGQTIGELWVSYHVKLSRPILEPSALLQVASLTMPVSTGAPTSLTIQQVRGPQFLNLSTTVYNNVFEMRADSPGTYKIIIETRNVWGSNTVTATSNWAHSEVDALLVNNQLDCVTGSAITDPFSTVSTSSDLVAHLIFEATYYFPAGSVVTINLPVINGTISSGTMRYNLRAYPVVGNALAPPVPQLSSTVDDLARQVADLTARLSKNEIDTDYVVAPPDSVTTRPASARAYMRAL